jgi:hypothetical protein
LTAAKGTSRRLDVLIVADFGDLHAAAVIDIVEGFGASAVRFNLADVADSGFTVCTDGVRLVTDQGVWAVGPHTKVWWHRSGCYDVSGLDDIEARLARDESLAALCGALIGCDAAWIDDPFVIERAELKLVQLSEAAKLGIVTPTWLVTNEVPPAQGLLRAGPTLAKALSAGYGIAPFAAEIGRTDVAAVSALPTLLQQVIEADADLRVVVVAGQAWVWRRERHADAIDWRAVDPHGEGFTRVARPEVAARALDLSRRLILTMSIQDWLETSAGPVLLEVNPQGKWAFLSEAPELVATALAAELVGL